MFHLRQFHFLIPASSEPEPKGLSRQIPFCEIFLYFIFVFKVKFSLNRMRYYIDALS